MDPGIKHMGCDILNLYTRNTEQVNDQDLYMIYGSIRLFHFASPSWNMGAEREHRMDIDIVFFFFVSNITHGLTSRFLRL